MGKLAIRFGKKFILIDKFDLMLITLFLVSAINFQVAIGLFALIILFNLFALRDSAAFLKILVLFVLRTTAMNSMIFRNGSINGAIRYILILICAVGMIIYSAVDKEEKGYLSIICMGLYSFSIISALGSVIYGSYPVVSIVKLILYSVAFYAVLRTIAATSHRVDWIDYFSKLFGLIFFASIFVIPFAVFRTRNGHAFQGVMNHPNVFGVYAPSFIALLCANKKIGLKIKMPFTIAVLYMLYLSESRTGLFASLFILCLVFMVHYKNRINQFVWMVLCVFIIGGIICVVFSEYIPSIQKIASDFLWKGAEGNLFYSKRGPIHRMLDKFKVSPLIGCGFMAPYEAGVQSWTMNFDMYVEDSNVFLSVLGGTGIIGFILWIGYNLYILIKGNKDYIYLFLGTFVISSGEMIFFSTNSPGLMLYIMIGLFLFNHANGNEYLEGELAL